MVSTMLGYIIDTDCNSIQATLDVSFSLLLKGRREVVELRERTTNSYFFSPFSLRIDSLFYLRVSYHHIGDDEFTSCVQLQQQ